MSDLAPFVAAAIRDRVVSDLKAENAALKKALKDEVRKSQLIQIVGEDAEVLQEAHLIDDAFEEFALEFHYDGKPFPKCKLSKLKGTIITVGGVKLETLNSQTSAEYFDYEEDGYVSLMLCIGCCTIRIDIHDWVITQRDLVVDDAQLWNYVTSTLSGLNPGLMVSFRCIMIDEAALKGLMERHTKFNEDDNEDSS